MNLTPAMDFQQTPLHPGSPTALTSPGSRQAPLPFAGQGQSALAAFPAQPMTSGFLRVADFASPGQTLVSHNLMIAIVTVTSRILAAMQRSYESKSFNELRETLTRETVGYGFYFLASPMILRLIPRVAPFVGMPKEYKSILLHRADGPKPKGMLKGLWWEFKGLFTSKVPSPSQLNQRRDELLNVAKQVFQDSNKSELFPKFEKDLSTMVRRVKIWRLAASVVGWVSAILLLGISVTLFNIYSTMKNLKAEEEAKAKARMKSQGQGHSQSGVAPSPFKQSNGAVADQPANPFAYGAYGAGPVRLQQSQQTSRAPGMNRWNIMYQGTP